MTRDDGDSTELFGYGWGDSDDGCSEASADLAFPCGFGPNYYGYGDGGPEGDGEGDNGE